MNTNNSAKLETICHKKNHLEENQYFPIISNEKEYFSEILREVWVDGPAELKDFGEINI